jgi:hypothetical protein
LDKEEAKRRAKIVAAEYGGLLPYAHPFYLASIIYSAEAALVAYSRYQESLGDEEDHSSPAAAIHEALGHAASLSRFFWSPRGDLSAARAAALRKELAVPNGSPLENRALRNALEHFDERLDAFLLTDAVGLLLPDPIIADSTKIDDPTAQIFKLVDPRNGVYVLFNEHFEFQPIIEEVSRICARAHDLYYGTDCADRAG